MRQSVRNSTGQSLPAIVWDVLCNGILYNHESPRRGENFVTQKIAGAAARIPRGFETEHVLGDLESRRDWGHAREYVRAMWLMLQHGLCGRDGQQELRMFRSKTTC